MNKMLKAILLIILALGLLIAGCSRGYSQESPASAQGSQLGNIAPDFRLRNLDGQYISLTDLRGKPVLINFWATWCPPCVYEMPLLQEIYEKWSGKGLEVLAIDVGESQSEVNEFLDTHNLSLPVLLDTEKDAFQKYNIMAIPTTVFIDKDGIIQQKVVGAFSTTAEIEKSLRWIMPEIK